MADFQSSYEAWDDQIRVGLAPARKCMAEGFEVYLIIPNEGSASPQGQRGIVSIRHVVSDRG